MPVPIEYHILRLTDRVEQMLQQRLPTELSNRETADYPLPVPASRAYVTDDTTLADIAQRLGSPETFIAIAYEPSRYDFRATGDGTEETYNAKTRLSVSQLLMRPSGAPMPDRNGHKIIIGQWMRVRAELVRGAIMRVLTERVVDGVDVHAYELVSAGVSAPGEIGDTLWREANVAIDFEQHVSTKTPIY